MVGTIDDVNYSGSATGTLAIGKADPVISWPAPAPIVYGAVLSGAELNASAYVPGTLVYSPAAGTVLPSGTHTLNASFTPTDTTDYNGVSESVALAVNPVAIDDHRE